MNADVFRRIELLRAWLEASPERFIAGELPSGNPSPPEEAQRAGYAEFLRHCDGGRFGPIDFFGGAQLPFEQGPADDDHGQRQGSGQHSVVPLPVEEARPTTPETAPGSVPLWKDLLRSSASPRVVAPGRCRLLLIKDRANSGTKIEKAQNSAIYRRRN